MNTEIFETMKAKSDEYMEKLNALKTAKQIALDTYGRDSDEYSTAYKLVSDFQKKNEILYNRGQGIAYRAYNNYKNGLYHVFVIDEFFYNCCDVKSFLDTIREAEIETFVVTNKSSVLMENIHDLVELGCVLEGTCTVMEYSKYGNSDHLGLSFRVNTLDKD